MPANLPACQPACLPTCLPALPPCAAHLLEEAKQRLGPSGSGKKGLPRGHKAVHFFQAGIEAHQPQAGRYDVIWLQWAALYLTDGGWGAGRAGWLVYC